MGWGGLQQHTPLLLAKNAKIEPPFRDGADFNQEAMVTWNP